MYIAGIIAEYNPFHMGHKYQIEKTREALGGDAGIICVMSGNFVQRGEPAAFLKSARAEAAVRSGADLVLELPLPWSLSSAEGFARGAVGVLGNTGVITHLSFGSESGDISPLKRAAEQLLRPEMDELIKSELCGGASYAAARQAALEKLTGESCAMLSSPNNILGVEYIKAIYDQRLDVAPLTIKRRGAGHDTLEGGDMPSASELRNRLAAGESMEGFTTEPALEIFEREIRNGRGPVSGEALECAILSRLRMLPDNSFERLPDAAEGLHNRLSRAARTQPSLDGVIAEAKTKRYALSRLRRMVMCAALGISGEDAMGTPDYIRILAANSRGVEILRQMQTAARAPVITKPSDINRLDARARRTFELESSATDLYVLGFAAKEERAGGRDWRGSPVILRDK